MWYKLFAELVVALHVGFIVFVLVGGLLVWRWRRAAWFHLPAAVWGAFIEFSGWTCPLTPLENWLRHWAGEVGYAGGFIEHYLLPVMYPAGFTSGMQVAAGVFVVAVNVAIYGWLFWPPRRVKESCAGAP